MTITDVQNCLRENNIDELICRVNPPRRMIGTMDLCKESPHRWVIRCNGRGVEGFELVFDSEEKACHEYLWLVLSEPTYRCDFKAEDILDYKNKVIPVLIKYGLPPIDYGTAHLPERGDVE